MTVIGPGNAARPRATRARSDDEAMSPARPFRSPWILLSLVIVPLLVLVLNHLPGNALARMISNGLNVLGGLFLIAVLALLSYGLIARRGRNARIDRYLAQRAAEQERLER